MAKRILLLFLIGGILMFGLSGCFGEKYKVNCDESFKGCKGLYSAGAKVTLYYDAIATDTNYSFFVDGESYNAQYSNDKGYIIEFTMPDHDVEVRVEAKNSMIYVSEDKGEAVLSFESFDGGGPVFNIVIDDVSVVTYDSVKKYNRADHEEMTGAGYNEYFTFFGLKEGETKLTVECRSPIAENCDIIYDVSVDSDLKVTITEIETIEIER